MAKEIFIQICPICGSKKIGLYVEDKATEAAAVEMYSCKRCKNIFAFPLEVSAKKARTIKEVPLTRALGLSTPDEAVIPLGKFEVGVYWKFMGAIMSLFGLFYILNAFIPVYCMVLESGVQCIQNTTPVRTAMLGLGMAAAGCYILLESYLITKLKVRQTKLLKVGLVVALLIALLMAGVFPFLSTF